MYGKTISHVGNIIIPTYNFDNNYYVATEGRRNGEEKIK